MADASKVWEEALPRIKNGVTGVGVWAALNAARPIALEDGVIVLGLPAQDSELAGHLKVATTKRLIESVVSMICGQSVAAKVIDGVSQEDYDTYKRREAERARLQQQALEKMRTELTARTSWDQVYEQLGRRFAAVSNKSLPQNRARFLEEAVELVAEARRRQATYDEAGERNFARCLERLAQYAEMPSTWIARIVLERAGEL
jgi:hypothetical protein